jgi:hypothetical protein
MKRLVARIGVVLTLAFLGAIPAGTSQETGLVVHEWGTFTTIAGEDGAAAQWLPLGGESDLPCFVNHLQNNPLIKWAAGGAPLSYEQARTALRGTVRMETPVLYFYAPRETVVDVGVRFPQGLLTEWYPKATVTQPAPVAGVLDKPAQSQIQWSGVTVRPGAAPSLLREAGPSHYYAARETDAAPVRVLGQDEKFLFYRGVGAFQVPLSAVLSEDGTVRVRPQSASPVPHVVLFENHGGRIGYRVQDDLRKPVTFEPAALTGDLGTLKHALEAMLVEAGLYEREAHAMVATWGDAWFEEGTRVFYLLPGSAVDAILPLTITPAPSAVARAFVGRIEIVTPAAICVVRDALAQADERTLNQYGRFLGPIADRLLRTASAGERVRTRSVLDAHYQSLLKQVTSACK